MFIKKNIPVLIPQFFFLFQRWILHFVWDWKDHCVKKLIDCIQTPQWPLEISVTLTLWGKQVSRHENCLGSLRFAVLSFYLKPAESSFIFFFFFLNNTPNPIEKTIQLPSRFPTLFKQKLLEEPTNPHQSGQKLKV